MAIESLTAAEIGKNSVINETNSNRVLYNSLKTSFDGFVKGRMGELFSLFVRPELKYGKGIRQIKLGFIQAQDFDPDVRVNPTANYVKAHQENIRYCDLPRCLF